MIVLFRQLRKKLGKDKPEQDLHTALVYFLIVILILTIGLMIIEGHSAFEATYQAIETVSTVGYGDNPPQTNAGKLFVTIFGFIIGLVLFANLADKYLAYRSFIREKITGGHMPNTKENGYIVVNFPGKRDMALLMENLRKTEPDVPICVIDEELSELPNQFKLSDVHFIKGSLANQETFIRANVKKAKVVYIYPKNECDLTTKSIVELISRFINGRARIMHFLVDPHNAWLFEKLNSTAILMSSEFFLAVQEGQDPGVAPAIQSLLQNTQGPIPVRVSPTENLIGLPWDKFKLYLSNHSSSIAPFALFIDGKPNMLPDPKTIISAETDIMVIKQPETSWESIAMNLV